MRLDKFINAMSEYTKLYASIRVKCGGDIIYSGPACDFVSKRYKNFKVYCYNVYYDDRMIKMNIAVTEVNV